MSPQALFGISVAFGFVAWSIVTALYIWPALRSQPHLEALRPLLVLHGFRFVGLAFLVPGVVSADLPAAFAQPAAYGDIAAAALALIALAALRSKAGILLVWVFNLWGTADLLYAFYQGNSVGLQPGHLGAAFFIPTSIVPLLITLGLVSWIPGATPSGREVRDGQVADPGVFSFVSENRVYHGESGGRVLRPTGV